jgi:hypothetical protein
MVSLTEFCLHGMIYWLHVQNRLGAASTQNAPRCSLYKKYTQAQNNLVICTYIYIYIYIYIHTYIHTHTYICVYVCIFKNKLYLTLKTLNGCNHIYMSISTVGVKKTFSQITKNCM